MRLDYRVQRKDLLFVLRKTKQNKLKFEINRSNVRSIDAKNVEVVGLSDGANSTSESREKKTVFSKAQIKSIRILLP